AKSGAPVIYVLDDAAKRAPGGAARWWLAQSLRALAHQCDAQPGPDGGRLLPGQAPADRLAPGSATRWSMRTPVASAGVALGKTYPQPLIDHVRGRERALAAYAKIR